MPESPSPDVPTAQDEVVDICRDLIRIDSSNYGDGTGPGERAAAEHVAGLLSEVGLEPEIFESADRRTSLVVRWEGEDTSRPGLLVHGHLDVVPAEARDWTHDPFAAEVVDGCVWGRGAVDMKDMDAMVLAVVRQWRREGRKPPRDVVLCFLADEEAGGKMGAHWMVDNHPGQFDGVSEAISEVGGFSFSIGQERVYLIETAQKGIRWLRLVAEGRAGHGSMVNDDNAVTALAEAVARIGRHDWPMRMTPTVQQFLEQMSDALGIELDLADPAPTLGDGFRVEVRIVTWEDSSALVVPASALVREERGWSVFTIEDGRARRRQVEIGQRGSATVQVRRGIERGERVLLFPSDAIADGVRVRAR